MWTWQKGCAEGVHQFEARYDESAPDVSSIERLNTTVGGAVEYLNAMKAKTYVYDICVRCGKIVKRESEQ